MGDVGRILDVSMLILGFVFFLVVPKSFCLDHEKQQNKADWD